MTSAERSILVKKAAGELGFERCGIAAAGPIPRGEFFREWLAKGYGGMMEYLGRHVESRIDVRAWLPRARSVIVVALNYRQEAPPRPDDVLRGRVAMYAWGEDYHIVVREKLEALVARIGQTLDVPFEARICVDTSTIIERELAAQAGIGWIGKNTMVLHQGLGSFFFLGEIVTDLELVPDAPEPDHCGTCTRCIEACPTNAFPRPYVMDARKCISYLTIEHRGDIEPALAERMGEWVFGCDICQDVCPYNHEPRPSGEDRFRGTSVAAWPALSEILECDDRKHAERVRGKATERARPAMWKRNAGISARNSAPAAFDGAV